MKYLVFVFMALLLTACASKPKVSQTPSIKHKKDLGIGVRPTPPPNHPIPGAKSRQMLVQEQMQKIRVPLDGANAPVPKIDKRSSNSLTIMSSSGGILTVWALAAGNWIWGYAPIDAYEFGDIAFWRIISLPNGQVMIKNEGRGTCLQAYKNGVIHEVCDSTDLSQLWNINFFDNRAVQIQSASAKTCLQTPFTRSTTYYSIFLKKCASNANIDQQWYIAPVIQNASPIFVVN